MHTADGRKVETAVEARAGFLDRPVLVVLCVSTALAVLFLAATWLGVLRF
jgi:fumarate reductase subunit C